MGEVGARRRRRSAEGEAKVKGSIIWPSKATRGMATCDEAL